MEKILEILQEEFLASLNKTVGSVKRDYAFPEAKQMVKVAVGIRRSGKTFFLFQTMRELLSQDIPIDRLLYLNFEDDRLLPMDQKKMGEMIDALYTLQPALQSERSYHF